MRDLDLRGGPLFSRNAPLGKMAPGFSDQIEVVLKLCDPSREIPLYDPRSLPQRQLAKMRNPGWIAPLPCSLKSRSSSG